MAKYRQFSIQISREEKATGNIIVDTVLAHIDLERVGTWHHSPETELYAEGTGVDMQSLDSVVVLVPYAEFTQIMKNEGLH